jgi:hypothetical protein
MNVRPERAELFIRTDRRTDMTKLIAAFRNFVNAITVLEMFVDKVLNDKQGTIYRAHKSEVGEPQRFFYGEMKVHC